jgi:hypothetical protein
VIQFHVDFWGPKLEMDEEATQTVLKADDVLSALGGLGALAAAAAIPVIGAAAAIVIGGIAAYIAANRAVIAAVDMGNGVWLTLPWPMIWWGQWWLIIPTTR